MKHVIFAGCSFSDEGRMTDDFDYKKYNLSITHENLEIPSTIKLHKLLAMDLCGQNIEDVKIYTIARGSYGNHVISDMFKKKVSEIKKDNPNDPIYGIIQFSALYRNGMSKNITHVKIEDYPYDYPNQELNYTDTTSLKTFYEKHLDNIIDLRNYCNENVTNSFFYFGWANIFDNDIVSYQLQEKIRTIEKFFNFYEYQDSYDEIGFYCAGDKPLVDKNIEYLNNHNLFYVNGNKYGGLSEYGRDNLDIGRRYHLLCDPHPSSETYYVYYNGVLKKWLQDNGIVQITPIYTHYEKILKKIFDLEYQRFVNTPDITIHETEMLDKETIKIIQEFGIEDMYNIIKKFKEFNRRLR